MTVPIDAFVKALASTTVPDHVFNQYQVAGGGDHFEANEVRRHNLKLYLEQMLVLRPNFLLVGEAPGYRGCRRTGVPFTSEAILLKEIEPVSSSSDKTARNSGLFGLDRGYRLAPDSNNAIGEATATMVWQELIRYWPPPILWNAFPFHPHQPQNPASNRPPKSAELAQGLTFLRHLAQIFDLTAFVAVGKSAKRVMELAGIDGEYIRHPSHGGKRRFAEGLLAITRPLDDLHYTSAHASDID